MLYNLTSPKQVLFVVIFSELKSGVKLTANKLLKHFPPTLDYLLSKKKNNKLERATFVCIQNS